jgi:hypothetical protein
LFFKVDTGGVATAALEQPGVLLPCILVVIHPSVGVGEVLNRSNVKNAVALDDVALLPLAPKELQLKKGARMLKVRFFLNEPNGKP